MPITFVLAAVYFEMEEVVESWLFDNFDLIVNGKNCEMGNKDDISALFINVWDNVILYRIIKL